MGCEYLHSSKRKEILDKVRWENSYILQLIPQLLLTKSLNLLSYKLTQKHKISKLIASDHSVVPLLVFKTQKSLVLSHRRLFYTTSLKLPYFSKELPCNYVNSYKCLQVTNDCSMKETWRRTHLSWREYAYSYLFVCYTFFLCLRKASFCESFYRRNTDSVSCGDVTKLFSSQVAFINKSFFLWTIL